MIRPGQWIRVGFGILAACLLAVPLTGCATVWQTTALSAVGATVAGARTPGNEIEQIYYLGVFDPQEQVPPTVYRVRVHGQASIISRTRFASGWVQASLIDSLGSHIEFNKETDQIEITKDSDKDLASLQTGRRLIMFGPEGFREAPKDHRLVIVMGASPEKYFEAMDTSLSVVSQVMAERRNDDINKLLLEAMSKTQSEHVRLDDLAVDVANDLPKAKEN